MAVEMRDKGDKGDKGDAYWRAGNLSLSSLSSLSNRDAARVHRCVPPFSCATPGSNARPLVIRSLRKRRVGWRAIRRALSGTCAGERRFIVLCACELSFELMVAAVSSVVATMTFSNPTSTACSPSSWARYVPLGPFWHVDLKRSI